MSSYCNICEKLKPRSEFSKTQLKHKSKTCKECVPKKVFMNEMYNEQESERIKAIKSNNPSLYWCGECANEEDCYGCYKIRKDLAELANFFE